MRGKVESELLDTNGQKLKSIDIDTLKGKSELAFFQDETGEIIYADKCRDCERSCKQSFRATIVTCPEISSKKK